MVKHTQRKKSKIYILLVFLMMVIAAVFIYRRMDISGTGSIHEKIKGEKKPPVFLSAKTSGSSFSISSGKLRSHNAILISLNDHSILMQKKSDEKIYPASLTKIMTAIVAIENLPDLQEKITLPSSIFKDLYSSNASMAGFRPNERVRAIDLLYGVMLPSGAESCIGLAEQIAGSEQGFVNIMNEKASELGMNNTHFTNATGLHDENHYTTVKDLAILLSYALENNVFREIFTSSRHTTKPTNKHPDGITFYSTLFENLNNSNTSEGEIMGGKTGYTEEAGLCLASLAKQGGKEYILVTAGAKGNHKSEQYNITDALAVYNSLGKE